MKRKLKLAAGILLALVLAVGGYFAWQIGPKNIWGMLRYDQRREGKLQVGQKAPEVTLTALDGTTKVKLLKESAGKPLVLIFGSFT